MIDLKGIHVHTGSADKISPASIYIYTVLRNYPSFACEIPHNASIVLRTLLRKPTTLIDVKFTTQLTSHAPGAPS